MTEDISKYRKGRPHPNPPEYPLEKMVFRVKKVGESTLAIALNPDTPENAVAELDDYRRRRSEKSS
jgi:hypothetical protein